MTIHISGVSLAGVAFHELFELGPEQDGFCVTHLHTGRALSFN